MSGTITGKALSRRSLLRGAFASVSLPFLDAMVPAFAASKRTPVHPARRLLYVYIAMGADQSRWTPSGGGKLEDLSYILKPFEPVKEDICVLVGPQLRLHGRRGGRERGVVGRLGHGHHRDGDAGDEDADPSHGLGNLVHVSSFR